LPGGATKKAPPAVGNSTAAASRRSTAQGPTSRPVSVPKPGFLKLLFCYIYFLKRCSGYQAFLKC